MCNYGQNLEWAEQYGLTAKQIRITAGLEDTGVLLEIRDLTGPSLQR